MDDRKRLLIRELTEIVRKHGNEIAPHLDKLKTAGFRIPSSWRNDAARAHVEAGEMLRDEIILIKNRQLGEDPLASGQPAPLTDIQAAILRVLNDGSCYIGDDLIDKVGCARSTLYKHLNPLIETGRVAKRDGGGYYRPDRVRD